MKYRDIAKVILIKRGSDERVRADDAKIVGELAEGRDEFTPKQVTKVQDALTDLVGKLQKKWKINED